MSKPKINQKLSKFNQTSRQGATVKYIVIHYVGAISSAKNNCIYFAGGDRRASAHFFVDSAIWQSIPLNKASWNCGGGLQDTGTKLVEGNKGARLHGTCKNANSIGIELCCTRDSKGRIVPSETAIKTAIPLVKWLMKEYNIPANRAVRHFDVTGKHCLPYDVTELLTPEGWKFMGDLDGTEQIAQYEQDSGSISFTEYDFSVKPRFDTVLQNRGLEATAGHRMMSKPLGASGVWKIRPWGEILEGKKSYIIPSGGHLETKGIDLTPEELRLLAWIQGDGHYMKGNPEVTPYYGIEWHMKKPRKIAVLKELLDDLEIQYSVCNQTDTTVKIRVYQKDFVDWAEKWLDNKCFDYNLLSMSDEQFKIFWNELLITDGCQSSGKELYTSTKEQNVDVVQSLCAIHGIRTNKYFSNTCFFLSKVYSNFTTSGRERKGCPVNERETLVGCVEVPTGLILIRQNGKTFIVGNCPNGYISKTAWAGLHKRLTGAATKTEPTKVNPDVPTGNLKKGIKGEDVKRLQRCLNKICGTMLKVDGSFGPATESALKSFQRRYGLEADGSCGPKTRAKLKEVLNK